MPDDRGRRTGADPHELLTEFLDEWREDRREGRTTRVLHEKVEGLDRKIDSHGERIVRLEAHRERDAEQRLLDGAGDTGRFRVPPPLQEPQSFWPRVLRSPVTIVLTSLALVASGFVARHCGGVAVDAVRSVPASTTSARP